MSETPEQHTARVLASIDEWIRSKPGNCVEVVGHLDGFVACATTFDAFTKVREKTLIGALANLLSALPPSGETADAVDDAFEAKEWGL